MASYRYLESAGVHFADCAGHVDLQTGLERLEQLRGELVRRASERHAKVLLDFRATVFENESVHQELSRVTRAKLGMNDENSHTYVALVNNRFEGEVSPFERWFHDDEAALGWLASIE